MNFFESYHELFLSREWEYYSRTSDIGTNDNFFMSEDFCDSFIRNYFDSGFKPCSSLFYSLSGSRKSHVVSAFFFGLLMLKHLSVGESIPPENIYLWFMTCLYHDTGYKYEIDNHPLPNEEMTARTISDFFCISNTLGEYYSIESVEKYLKYKKLFYKKGDHGILGACDLYCSLKEQHEQNLDLAREGNDGKKYLNGVLIDNGIIEKFRRISTYVCIHNIFFLGKTSDRKNRIYYQREMPSLIGKIERMSQEDVAFWLLVVADAVEPIKRYEGTNTPMLLENIHIKEYRNGICVYMNPDIDGFSYNMWESSVVSLREWTPIKTRKMSNGRIYINISPLLH